METSHKFLHQRFPDWQHDGTTHMIPPIFMAKGPIDLGTENQVSYSDVGDQGEAIIYDYLEDFGRKNSIGMFVIHGFLIRTVATWNQKHPEHKVPDIKLGEEMENVTSSYFIILLA
jgi:hypothetical protein